MWGDAADVFVDESPRDGIIDDLNHDGRITPADAAVLRDLVEGLFDRPFYQPFIGGLGTYPATPAHGPFVHLDARGDRARWEG